MFKCVRADFEAFLVLPVLQRFNVTSTAFLWYNAVVNI